MSQLTKISVFYFRGINSAGDDCLRFGRIKLRPMHYHLQKYFVGRGIQFIPVHGLGARALTAQAERALSFFRNDPHWCQSSNHFHFLGHSAGGLLARAVAHQLGEPQKVASLTTFATPHRGAIFAKRAQLFAKNRPYLHQAFKAIGYDITERLATLSHLEPQAVADFLAPYPDLEPTRRASLTFAVQEDQLSWPLRFARALDLKMGNEPNDGLVELSSQSWGEALGEFQLDHLGQIGFDLSPFATQRRRTVTIFRQMCERMIEFWSEVEASRA